MPDFDPAAPCPKSIPIPGNYWARYLPGRQLAKLVMDPIGVFNIGGGR